MAKRSLSKNASGLAGGLMLLAGIGIIGYVILRRDEILQGIDRRLNIQGGGSAGSAAGSTTGNTGDNSEIEQGGDNIDNNNNDSSNTNQSNQRNYSYTPRKSSQHNDQYAAYSKIIKGPIETLQQQNQNQAGYDLAIRTSRGLTQQQAERQYYANRQGYNLAATFQSESKPLPKGNRNYAGAVPPALKHLFPKSISNRPSPKTPAAPPPVPKRPTKRNLYAGLTGGHTGFRGAGRN